MATDAEAIERELDRLLPAAAGSQARLHEAMRYATLGGGKRLRPFLVLASGALFDVPAAQARRVGAAIELVHSYSLVHDDLPAMDDALTAAAGRAATGSSTRPPRSWPATRCRPWPSRCWRSPRPIPIRRSAASWSRALRVAAGAAGMCGGQMIDLEAEQRRLTMDQVLRAAAAEDRRADRLRLRGGRDPGRGAGRRARRRCAAMPPISASPSRSRTICWTSRAMPR